MWVLYFHTLQKAKSKKEKQNTEQNKTKRWWETNNGQVRHKKGSSKEKNWCKQLPIPKDLQHWKSNSADILELKR